MLKPYLGRDEHTAQRFLCTIKSCCALLVGTFERPCDVAHEPPNSSVRSYPLAERDSLLRRDRATRSRVCLRLRSHSTQPGLCNATGAGCSATVGGVALHARRSTSSQSAITSGRRVARRTLVVSAKSSVLSILFVFRCLAAQLLPSKSFSYFG
jgi:hypothetical protein